MLIVDDDVDIREILAETLTETGFDVRTACNGLEALAAVRRMKDRPAVILLDLMMPIMDGYGFLEQRERDPALASIPIAIVTAGYGVDRRGLAKTCRSFASRSMCRSSSAFSGRSARNAKPSHERRQPRRCRHEQRFELLVASIKDYAIFLLDTSGRVATWNAGAHLIKGYLPEEIVGKHISIFYTPEDRAAASRKRCSTRPSGRGASRSKGGACGRTASGSGRTS